MKNTEYMIAENNAYENLVSKGYTPQGRSADLKTVCIMKFEHPEFHSNPVKCGKREIFYFKNFQEADAKLN